ncbi:MAG: hypothetical protein A2252_10220 [Elusimicrobia bacterium RIFOXYA2_FULL_39_19]|nr:MAG: hypothetical protein A2252_10220 [Elusimicrobia bacterium RIFOXYA2_FULL_39_19]
MSQKIRLPEQNNVTLIGRLTADPVLRYTQKGQGVCRFDIAVNRSYRDTGGEWQKEVNFIPIVVWRDSALRCNERLKKGSPVFVTGRLRNRSWEDKQGQKHSSLEVEVQKIQFLQALGDDSAESPAVASGENMLADTNKVPETSSDTSEEEIPF